MRGDEAAGFHAANRHIMGRLERDAQRISARFGLRYRALLPERANVRRRYGVCYADGRIKIRLRHAVTGQPLRYSSLVNTLCHELAHLRHFNHGERFRTFYRQILEYARSCGIYRPSRREPAFALPLAARRLPAAAWEASPRSPALGGKEVPRPTQRAGPEQLALFG